MREAVGIDVAVRKVALATASVRTALVPLPKYDGARSLLEAFDILRTEMRAFEAEPFVVAVEQPFGKFNKQHLDHVVGVTLAAAAWAWDCPVLSVPTARWKSLAMSRGNAKKDDVMAWALRQGYEGTSQDEADALGIARAAARLLEEQLPLDAVG